MHTRGVCSQAKLRPLDPTLGYHNATAASWGGRAIRGDGHEWHLYVSQFRKGCPLAYWSHNSFIARAVSTAGPAGPYHYAEEVYPVFHHNPTVVGPTPDGRYLMFMIGQTNASDIVDCAGGHLPTPGTGVGGPMGTISMGHAPSPHGPWSAPRVVLRNFDRPTQDPTAWDCYVTNPSAVVQPNGTVLLVFSSVPCTGGFEEALGIAVAPSWNSTYVQVRRPIWQKPGPRQSPDAVGVGNVEDPFVFVDRRGNYHIIAHSQGATNVCGGNRFVGSACAVHFFARSPLGPWRHSDTAVFGPTAPLANGTVGWLLGRQRPQIIFRADGTPAVMLNGGSFDEYNRGVTALEHTPAFQFDVE